jgi:hypothetical protein
LSAELWHNVCLLANDDVDRVAADQPTIFEDRYRDSGPTFC